MSIKSENSAVANPNDISSLYRKKLVNKVSFEFDVEERRSIGIHTATTTRCKSNYGSILQNYTNNLLLLLLF